ncbi:hypothetical protein R6Q59_008883 [Mikania micrantha]
MDGGQLLVICNRSWLLCVPSLIYILSEYIIGLEYVLWGDWGVKAIGHAPIVPLLHFSQGLKPGVGLQRDAGHVPVRN